jgi:type I restriction enzyme R subunit
MIEFKQIIGRGTRLYEGKYYFTIHDFVKAHEHFNDPEWDGEPIEPEAPSVAGSRTRAPSTAPHPEKPEVIRITLADGKERTLQHMVQTTFWSTDGKPMSSSQFLESLFGALPSLFEDEDELRRIWSDPETRRRLLDQLAEEGFAEDQMNEMKKLISAERSDLFDVLAYVAYATPPITREQRALMATERLTNEFGDNEVTFLEFVLGHYVEQGVTELDSSKLPQLLELKYDSMAEALPVLGAPSRIREMFVGFQSLLYAKQPSAV